MLPYIDWFDFCPECGHFTKIDQESTLGLSPQANAIAFESVLCFSCADEFWEEYRVARQYAYEGGYYGDN